MHSPLPDASALEAGIVEDELPSRLSRVQENVRNLLRNSRIVSLGSSPPATTMDRPNLDNGMSTPPESPTRQPPRVIPSPTAQGDEMSEHGAPPSSYRHAVQQMAHQSTLFNTRAVAALNHPDLTDPSLAAHLRHQKDSSNRQRHAWKRSRHGRKRSAAFELGSSQSLLCVLAALLLAATVATYIVLATTSSNVTPTFHILFILGIILATIVFAHSMIRLLLFSRSRSKSDKRKAIVMSPPRHQHRRHRHRRNGRGQQGTISALTPSNPPFVPTSPIPVHVGSDGVEPVRPDSREAHPTATVDLEQQLPLARSSWDKDADTVANPPPAYGRWRGSVRANPDLLHWQVVPSPVADGTPALASPTYEEAVGEEQTRPPSYVTRDSPARRRGAEVADGEGEGERANLHARVDEAGTETECEMVEVGGGGLGVVG